MFATGLQTIGVTLLGDVQVGSSPERVRLVDTAMQLALPGAVRRTWDTLELEATVGTYALAVTAGDRPAATIDLTVVDHADAITVNAYDAVEVNRSTLICFSAHNAARYVAGLAWSFGTDNGEVDDTGGLFPNCATFRPDTLGPATLIASAGGQQVTVSLTVQ
nr:hypothetical protein [Deltaproteobacteria bacterium]